MENEKLLKKVRSLKQESSTRMHKFNEIVLSCIFSWSSWSSSHQTKSFDNRINTLHRGFKSFSQNFSKKLLVYMWILSLWKFYPCHRFFDKFIFQDWSICHDMMHYVTLKLRQWQCIIDNGFEDNLLWFFFLLLFCRKYFEL